MRTECWGDSARVECFVFVGSVAAVSASPQTRSGPLRGSQSQPSSHRLRRCHNPPVALPFDKTVVAFQRVARLSRSSSESRNPLARRRASSRKASINNGLVSANRKVGVAKIGMRGKSIGVIKFRVVQVTARRKACISSVISCTARSRIELSAAVFPLLRLMPIRTLVWGSRSCPFGLPLPRLGSPPTVGAFPKA